MHLSDYKHFVGNLAVITTILQFLSGILVCRKYVVNRTTAEETALPFICCILSAGVWLLYGLTKHDKNIVLVNTFGIILMVSYTVVFYIYTYKKTTVLKQIFCILALFLFVVGYVSVEEDNEVLLSRLGLLACSLTIVTIAAPISKLLYVIKVKSTECLPYPMILMSFFVSMLWFLYGQIEEDIYLSWPNFIGAALALSQLSLFVIYPRTAQTPLLTKGFQA